MKYWIWPRDTGTIAYLQWLFFKLEQIDRRHLDVQVEEGDRILFYRTKNNGGSQTLVALATVVPGKVQEVTDKSLRVRNDAEYPLYRRVHLDVAVPPGLQHYGVTLSEVNRVRRRKPTARIRIPFSPSSAIFLRLERMLVSRARALGMQVKPAEPGHLHQFEEDQAATQARDMIRERARHEHKLLLDTARAIVEYCSSRPLSAVPSTGGTVRHYQTNRVLAESLKLLYAGKCQICDSTFNDKAGDPYAEVHHIKPLTKDGPDSPGNMMVLCPTCHRKMHHAAIRGAGRALATGRVFINGVPHEVHVHPIHVSR